MNNKKVIKIARSYKVYIELAQNMLLEERYELAIYYLFKALEEKESADVLCLIGDVYSMIGLYESAFNYYLRALNKVPNDEDILDKIGQTLINLDLEDIAFFYFSSNMTVKRFNSLMQEELMMELLSPPDIRIVEKNDDATINIALKLIESGDWSYAKEILLTIKPHSNQYAKACNLLAVHALENDEYDKALKYTETALKKNDFIFSRCNQLYIFDKLNDNEKLQEVINIIEGSKIDINDKKAVAMAYLRINRPEYAQNHLADIINQEPYERNCLVSYALCKYALNDKDTAKNLMLKAHHVFPLDVEIFRLLSGINSLEELGLFPCLSEELEKQWLSDIDEGLDKVRDSVDGLINDSDFVMKINWLFQSDYYSKQNKAALILTTRHQWRHFFLTLLLDNYWNVLSKKAVLFSLLYNQRIKNLAIVLEGMYTRLKISYPNDMDDNFFTAYCLAFSSFAFCDSSFETRLYKSAQRLLKKYNLDTFDKTKIVKKEGLAAVIFYYARHEKIKKLSQCAHIFGCTEKELSEYIKVFE